MMLNTSSSYEQTLRIDYYRFAHKKPIYHFQSDQELKSQEKRKECELIFQVLIMEPRYIPTQNVGMRGQ